MRALLALLLMSRLAAAEGEPAGDFDYFVLSLSWSPNWCALEGDDRNSPQCSTNGFGWVLHGLWPQYEQGWPSYCRTDKSDPSRRQTKDMAPIMGSSGSAWYQWKKHGRCSGLSSEDFYSLALGVYLSVNRPAVFRNLENPVKLPANVVEQAFLAANPDLTADMITITCKQARIQEARICYGKDLNPRICGSDVVRDCQMQDALMDPPRYSKGGPVGPP
ncbi:MAG: ribonuclease T2 [Paracoccaceae bacterium]